MKYNLLKDPLISVLSAEGFQESMSLPQILAELTAGERIHGFADLQPHQAPPWYTFLIQTAALACLDTPHEWNAMDALGWHNRLKALTASFSDDEPWRLVVRDSAQPAFMQPPVPEGTLNGFKGPMERPDHSSLDILVTARHHDLKSNRIQNPSSDHWIYGMLALQTFIGFSGRDNYGVVRMNGGYGSRPVVGWAPSTTWGARFRRDLPILLREHDTLADQLERPARGGLGLLWLEPWDGNHPCPLRKCDPFVIEVARRIRLTERDGRIVAYYQTSKAPRIDPKSDLLKGVVGDPWIPIKQSDPPQALTVDARGFHYELFRQLLFQDEYRGGACQQLQPEDSGEMYFYGTVLARGQGGTSGLHERWLRVPAKIRPRFASPQAKASLSQLAKERVKRAGNVRNGALRPALLTLLQGAPEKLDLRAKTDRRWSERFDMDIDEIFFERLWADADLDGTEQTLNWCRELRMRAARVLEQAEREALVPDTRRERAVARAWITLERGMRKHLPELYAPKEEPQHD